MYKTEKSFRVEMILAVVFMALILLSPFGFIPKLILFITGFLVLVAEAVNSAIENTVDLVTDEVHPLAKAAKDIGSGIVLLTIILHIITWGVLWINYWV